MTLCDNQQYKYSCTFIALHRAAWTTNVHTELTHSGAFTGKSDLIRHLAGLTEPAP